MEKIGTVEPVTDKATASDECRGRIDRRQFLLGDQICDHLATGRLGLTVPPGLLVAADEVIE